MALVVRDPSSQYSPTDYPLPSPFLHLRLAIETVPIWDRALITYIRAFYERTTFSAKIAANQALERQIAKKQFEVNGIVDESEEDEDFYLQARVENLATRMIAQRHADFTFAGVSSEREFKRKTRQLNRYKSSGLELYSKIDGVELKKKIDYALFSAIRGRINGVERQCLDRYWEWVSSQTPWSHLCHWHTEIAICQSIFNVILEAMVELDPREKPHFKADFGHRLKKGCIHAIEHLIIKLATNQLRKKEHQIKLTYMMHKIEILKIPIIRMILKQKIEPLIRSCEEEIQKLAQTKRDKKDPLKSARKEWIEKRKEYDPLKLRKILAEETPTDRIVIQALFLSMGHDLERTFAEQEFLDIDIAADLTISNDPALYLRYQLKERDEKALAILTSIKA
jgi:hypothetical protein